jgi:hypothetical protein
MYNTSNQIQLSLIYKTYLGHIFYLIIVSKGDDVYAHNVHPSIVIKASYSDAVRITWK